ncbi:hypothetical protein KIN20_005770, partial [Parelaphostrongylus tenuis]
FIFAHQILIERLLQRKLSCLGFIQLKVALNGNVEITGNQYRFTPQRLMNRIVVVLTKKSQPRKKWSAKASDGRERMIHCLLDEKTLPVFVPYVCRCNVVQVSIDMRT